MRTTNVFPSRFFSEHKTADNFCELPQKDLWRVRRYPRYGLDFSSRFPVTAAYAEPRRNSSTLSVVQVGIPLPKKSTMLSLRESNTLVSMRTQRTAEMLTDCRPVDSFRGMHLSTIWRGKNDQTEVIQYNGGSISRHSRVLGRPKISVFLPSANGKLSTLGSAIH